MQSLCELDRIFKIVVLRVIFCYSSVLFNWWVTELIINKYKFQYPQIKFIIIENLFVVNILDLHWINGGDDPNDLCAHGHVYTKIGNQIISENETGDWTLSSTALNLLRSIRKDYEKDYYSNQLLLHCGHFFIADDSEETVLIQGCNIGID